MSQWPHVDTVDVRLDFGTDGTFHVGVMAIADERVFFAYEDGFVSRDLNPAPFSLPLLDEPFAIPVRNGAPGSMFSDAVPDGWTRHLLDARILEAGFEPSDLSPIDRLALVGGNGIGALSFSPSHDMEAGVQPLTLEDLAATVLATGQAGDAGLETARLLAGSLGGMRPKANVWLAADGTFTASPQPHGSPWIVKFPRPGFDPPDAGPIEFAYSLMAQAAGIEMTATRLLETKDGPGYFATARFDRLGERRFHYQSLAGLLDLDPLQRSSYGALLGIEKILSGASDPDEQLVRRMIFNVLAANRDDHTRNHGFLMNAEGIWTPAPAFDVTFEPLKEHVLVVGSSARSPTDEDIVSVVVEAGGSADRTRTMIAEIRGVVEEWPAFANKAGVSGETVERIAASMRSLRRNDTKWARAAAMEAARGWDR
jgi:serine/threonine-protein kinase HipA